MRFILGILLQSSAKRKKAFLGFRGEFEEFMFLVSVRLLAKSLFNFLKLQDNLSKIYISTRKRKKRVAMLYAD
tara:strand:- start:3148 stop:3366 length:219 start_codon:yes stop_codon:yes gene_type:complete